MLFFQLSDFAENFRGFDPYTTVLKLLPHGKLLFILNKEMKTIYTITTQVQQGRLVNKMRYPFLPVLSRHLHYRLMKRQVKMYKDILREYYPQILNRKALAHTEKLY